MCYSTQFVVHETSVPRDARKKQSLSRNTPIDDNVSHLKLLPWVRHCWPGATHFGKGVQYRLGKRTDIFDDRKLALQEFKNFRLLECRGGEIYPRLWAERLSSAEDHNSGGRKQNRNRRNDNFFHI